MIREILQIGDERLTRIAKPVDNAQLGQPALHTLVQDMFDTMYASGGVGLAAPQIGVDLRILVLAFDGGERSPDTPVIPPTVMINPSFSPVEEGELEEGWEGCLSVPDLRGNVPRHARIRYQALNADGALLQGVAEGFHARIIQHEYDHLEGILYPERMTESMPYQRPLQNEEAEAES